MESACRQSPLSEEIDVVERVDDRFRDIARQIREREGKKWIHRDRRETCTSRREEGEGRAEYWDCGFHLLRRI